MKRKHKQTTKFLTVFDSLSSEEQQELMHGFLRKATEEGYKLQAKPKLPLPSWLNVLLRFYTDSWRLDFDALAVGFISTTTANQFAKLFSYPVKIFDNRPVEVYSPEFNKIMELMFWSAVEGYAKKQFCTGISNGAGAQDLNQPLLPSDRDILQLSNEAIFSFEPGDQSKLLAEAITTKDVFSGARITIPDTSSNVVKLLGHIFLKVFDATSVDLRLAVAEFETVNGEYAKDIPKFINGLKRKYKKNSSKMDPKHLVTMEQGIRQSVAVQASKLTISNIIHKRFVKKISQLHELLGESLTEMGSIPNEKHLSKLLDQFEFTIVQSTGGRLL